MIFSDKESDFDYLGIMPYISTYEYLIQHDHCLELPIVFGVHGNWGVGKSTFMNILEGKLSAKNNLITVYINPWEYTTDVDFSTLFLTKLYSKISDIKDIKLNDSSITKLVTTLFKPLKINGGIKNIVNVEYDFSKINIDSKKSIIDSFINEELNIKSTINEIIDAINDKNYKVVLFIDDLDRCSPDKVMEVLESIKLLLSYRECIFFLACDNKYIEKAIIEKHNTFILDESELYTFAKEYLEKFIQVPFYLPPVSEKNIHRYIDEIFERKDIEHIDIENKEDLLNDVVESIKSSNAMKEMIYCLPNNARKIKRVLNQVVINYLFIYFKNLYSPNRVSEDKVFVDLELVALLVIGKELGDDLLMSGIRSVDEFKKYIESYKVKEILESDCKNRSLQRLYKSYHDKYRLDDEVFGTYIEINNISFGYDKGLVNEILNITSNLGSHQMIRDVISNKMMEKSVIRHFLIVLFEKGYFPFKKYIDIEISSEIGFYIKGNETLENRFMFQIDYNENNKLHIRFYKEEYNTCMESIIINVVQNKSVYSYIDFKEGIVIDSNETFELVEKKAKNIVSLVMILIDPQSS